MRIKSLLFAGLILFNNAATGQNFEGKMVYRVALKSKLPNFTDRQLEVLVGNKQEYFIKDGNYKSLTNGQALVMQLYDDSTNRIYNQTSKSDTLYWFSASLNSDDVLSYEIEKNSSLILGHQCDALVIKTKSGTTTFYYSKEYPVDSAKFKNHNYGNWAFFTARAGTLPLKIVVDNNQFTMESIAIEIKPLKLEKKYFQIDEKTPSKQSL